MAKDPAMLWYWADWNSGTTTFSRFLKGCYMDVLHAQFNSGRLTLEEIKTVLGSDFGQAWPTLQKKFAVDDTGKYFNERLELEKKKRAEFTQSRRSNLEGKKTTHTDYHMKILMDHHMENVNVDTNQIQVFGNKKESFISIRKIFANDRAKLIYDLHLYFSSRGQLSSFEKAGLVKFEDFMTANPANVFDDDNHLYNAFRKFCLTKQLMEKGLNGKSRKRLTIDDLNQ